MISRSLKLRWWWWGCRESIKVTLHVRWLWAKISGSWGRWVKIIGSWDELVVLIGLGDTWRMMIRPRTAKGGLNLTAIWLWMFEWVGTAIIRFFMIGASWVASCLLDFILSVTVWIKVTEICKFRRPGKYSNLSPRMIRAYRRRLMSNIYRIKSTRSLPVPVLLGSRHLWLTITAITVTLYNKNKPFGKPVNFLCNILDLLRDFFCQWLRNTLDGMSSGKIKRYVRYSLPLSSRSRGENGQCLRSFVAWSSQAFYSQV